MKLVIFMTLLMALQATASSHAQHITLKVQNITLAQAMRSIQQQSGHPFFLNGRDLAKTKVSATLRDATLEEAMGHLLAPLALDWVLKGETIVIKPTVAPTTKPQMPAPLTLQTRQLTGRVADDQGNAIAGVTVTVRGTSTTAVTESNGTYRITVPERGTALVFSAIGFEATTLGIGDSEIINVTMKASVSDLEEVVVVGYGTVRKSDLTGSVATVSEKDIKSTPVVDFGRALQGRSPGVLVTQNSGSPGAPATIRIRGTGSVNASNDPLYVIDGFPTGSINTINPADIESIEILKDASSTAIYGSRGSNGVVIVTTKRGKTDQNEVAFESYYGLQQARRTIPLLNSQQYAEFVNEARVNGGLERYFDGSTAERPLPNQLTTDTDWQRSVLRTAPLQQYQLMLTGGERKTRYAISGNIYDQDGIIERSSFKRYTLRTNVDRELSSWVSVGLNLAGAMTNGQAARAEIGGGANAGVMNAAINYAPVFPIYGTDGNYYRDQGPLNGNLVDNPVGIAREVTDKSLTNRLLVNAFADIRLLDGLTFRTSLGGNVSNAKLNYYVTRNIGLGMGTNGMARVTAGMTREWLNENTLTFTRDFADRHHLTALAGYTVQGIYGESVVASAGGFNDDFALYHNLGAGSALQRPGSDANEWGLRSYLARINYRYQDRFLLTLTARTDGSSRFGPNKKYGFFPSGAFAWRIINESFMQDQTVFSDLKLRVSYGLTGNQDIQNFGYLSLISNILYPLGGANPVLHTGAIPSGISNLNLGWESNAQLDVGLDIALLSNRVRLTADYYRKRTFDLLFNVNVPETTGYSGSLRNIGEIENRGFEIGLNADLVSKPNLEWTTTINVTTNRNKILSLDGRDAFTSGASSSHHGVSNTILMKVGESVGNFYGRKVVGIFQTDAEAQASGQANAVAGDLRFADIDGNGEINDNDRTVIGNGNPPVFGGMTQYIRWRNLDLTVFLQGSLGNDILNFARFDLYNLNGNNNQSVDVLDRWTPTNPSQTIPRATSTGGQRILSSFHIEDGSYLRVKNIALGYTFPRGTIRGIGFGEIRFYAAAQNYLTFTHYKGFDPEVSRYGSSAMNQGMDFDGYPNAKTILLGLNIKL